MLSSHLFHTFKQDHNDGVRLLVTGDSKRGKTSLAFALAYEHANAGGNPLFICNQKKIEDDLPWTVRVVAGEKDAGNDDLATDRIASGYSADEDDERSPAVMHRINMKYVASPENFKEIIAGLHCFDSKPHSQSNRQLPSMIVIDDFSKIVDPYFSSTRSDDGFLQTCLAIGCYLDDALRVMNQRIGPGRHGLGDNSSVVSNSNVSSYSSTGHGNYEKYGNASSGIQLVVTDTCSEAAFLQVMGIAAKLIPLAILPQKQQQALHQRASSSPLSSSSSTTAIMTTAAVAAAPSNLTLSLHYIGRNLPCCASLHRSHPPPASLYMHSTTTNSSSSGRSIDHINTTTGSNATAAMSVNLNPANECESATAANPANPISATGIISISTATNAASTERSADSNINNRASTIQKRITAGGGGGGGSRMPITGIKNPIIGRIEKVVLVAENDSSIGGTVTTAAAAAAVGPDGEHEASIIVVHLPSAAEPSTTSSTHMY